MSEPQTIRAQDGRGGWTRAGIGLASDQRTTDQARKAAAGLPWIASCAVCCGEHPPELRHQRLSGSSLTDRRPVVVDLIEKLFFRMARKTGAPSNYLTSYPVPVRRYLGLAPPNGSGAGWRSGPTVRILSHPGTPAEKNSTRRQTTIDLRLGGWSEGRSTERRSAPSCNRSPPQSPGWRSP
jgi:hypothetical protein